MKRKILLVGGAGFIGHNLAVLLKKKKQDVIVADNLKVNSLNFIRKEIKDKNKKKLYNTFIEERLKLLKKNKNLFKKIDAQNKKQLNNVVKKYHPDVLVHLAAVSHDGRSNKNPELAFNNSFKTLFNSLESVKDLKNSFLFFFHLVWFMELLKKALLLKRKIAILLVYMDL